MYPMPSLTHMLDILGNSSRGVTWYAPKKLYKKEKIPKLTIFWNFWIFFKKIEIKFKF